MKLNFFILPLLIACPLQTIFSQDITVGDAIEQPELTWTVETFRSDTMEPLDVGLDNQWSVVTEGTSDGIDALTVKAPELQPAIARISTNTNGPFILKFKTRTDFPGSNTGLGYQLIDSLLPLSNSVTTIEPSGEWAEQTVAIIRDTHNFYLSFQVSFTGDQNAQAWLDEVEIIREFPPTVTETFPKTFTIPTGKSARLENKELNPVFFGTLSYQWYKDGDIVEGATNRHIDFAPQQEPSNKSDYELEISDELGALKMPATEVFYYSLNDVLENDELVFTIEDLPLGDYSTLLRSGSDAPDGKDALYIATFAGTPFSGDQDDLKTLKEIKTTVKGPTILRFDGKARVIVNGINPETKSAVIDDQFTTTYIPIDNSLENAITFSSAFGYAGHPIGGTIDNVQLSQEPVFTEAPIQQAILEGSPKSLPFDSVSLGNTKYQLLKGEEVILETNHQTDLALSSLSASDSGIFTLKIDSSIGGSITSDPFTIQIYPTIGEAVEQPNLEWTYEGEKIWIPQIFETYDGDDAAALLDEGEGMGSVSTLIDGPAFVSFWFKNNISFTVNEQSAGLENPTGNWQKAEIALTSGSNQLTWRTGFFDRLQIEQVDTIGEAVEQPDLEWSYTGNRIWVPQTEESYDGVDAAALINDSEGNGTVATVVEGPSLVSFWWKNGSTFNLNDEILDYEGEGWQFVQQVAWEDSNTLQWDAGFFDQLEIESLKEDPFRLWAFEKFPTEQVAADLESIADGDRDYDTLNNVIEWALNKNLDFPNRSLEYRLVEADGGTYLGLTFSRPADLGTFTINLESSVDLTNWEKIEAVILETFNASNDTYTVTIRDIQALDTKDERFIRLVISDEG